MGFTVEVAKNETLLSATEEPKFLLSQEGIYLKKTGLLGTSLTPMDEMPKSFPTLGKYKNGGFTWNAPKIPRQIIGEALSFFRTVFTLYQTEAVVLIMKNFTTNQYQLFVPYQDNSLASVDYIYDPADVPLDCQIIGSIHSHCDFGARHSSTDEKDAEYFDGIHITIGHVDKATPDYDAMVCQNGINFEFKISDVAQTSKLNRIQAPLEWLNLLLEKEEILKIDFPTLTEEFVEEWAKPKPVVTVFDKTTTKNLLDALNFGVQKSYGYYPQNRWSFEIHQSVPAAWLDEYGRITSEHLEDGIKQALAELELTFSRRGILIEWDILNMNEEKFDDITQESIDEINEKAIQKLLLPGAFGIREIK